jgi:DNA-directed RNA polymerase specialized sigma24 family protein
VREAAVEARIARLAALPTAKLLAAVRADEDDVAARVPEEALVALCRRRMKDGDSGTAWKIALVLAERVRFKVANSLRLWRLDSPESRAREVADDVIGAMYEAVFDTSAKSAFWEIRFWVAFDRRLLDAIRRKRVEIDRTVALTIAGDEEDDGGELGVVAPSPDHGSDRARKLIDPVVGAMVAEALAGLPRKTRTAYILRTAAEMPIDSKDETRLTISRVLGVSARSVRYYIQEAERAIDEWRGDTKGKGNR